MALVAEAKGPFVYGILRLPNGLPNHDTFSRLLRNLDLFNLDPEQYRASSQLSMARPSEQSQGMVAVDGNGLRGSFDRARSRSVPHQVSALDRDGRLVLAQTETDAKSIENIVAPKLLKTLSLKSSILSAADAFRLPAREACSRSRIWRAATRWR
jgi:hypothetical protein